MSDVRSIHKYKIVPGGTSIEAPHGAVLLSVHAQQDCMFAWFLVDPEQPMSTRRYAVLGTGQLTPSPMLYGLVFAGTIHVFNGSLVFHVWMEPPKP